MDAENEIRILKQEIETWKLGVAKLFDSIEFLMDAQHDSIEREREDLAESKKDVERRLKRQEEDSDEEEYVPDPKYKDPAVG